MRHFIQLSITELKRIFSNSVVMMIFFGAPLAYGVLFGYTYKSAKIVDLPIAVVDLDASPMSDKIIDALNDNESIKVIKVYRNTDGLKHELIKNNYQAIVTIPERFEADINQKRYPEINTDVNMTNILTANFASRGIQTVLGTLNAGIEIEALKKQGISASNAATRYEAFKANFNRLYNPGNSYLEFMWPGLIGAIIQQIFFLSLALAFARDFEDKYFSKLVQHKHNAPYLILLKILPFYLLGLIVWGLIAIMYNWFNVHLQVFNGEMYLLSFLFTTAAIFIGILFSIVIPSQLKATEMLMVIAVPGFIISGFTWPLSEMPVLIQWIAQVIPLTHFLEGLRKVAIYGGHWQDIQPQINALLYIILVSVIVSILVLQWKVMRERKRLKSGNAVSVN